MISDALVEKSKFIVIAIFNRFGDGVIAATACREFIEKWSAHDRKFVIFTSPQLFPYLSGICRGIPVYCFRRKNPLDWVKAWSLVKFGKGPSLGLNPCSYGKESRRLISFADTSFRYKDLSEATSVNLYDKIRIYMGLPRRGGFVGYQDMPQTAKQILFCPESTEKRKTLTPDMREKLLGQIRSKWPEARVVVATANSDCASTDSQTSFFVFQKSRRKSEEFIALVKSSDLVISVDSGPAHIAISLGKFVIGVFSSTHPASIMYRGADALALRSNVLADVFCEVKGCSRPMCMAELKFDAAHVSRYSGPIRVVEGSKCPAGFSNDDIGLRD